MAWPATLRAVGDFAGVASSIPAGFQRGLDAPGAVLTVAFKNQILIAAAVFVKFGQVFQRDVPFGFEIAGRFFARYASFLNRNTVMVSILTSGLIISTFVPSIEKMIYGSFFISSTYW